MARKRITKTIHIMGQDGMVRIKRFSYTVPSTPLAMTADDFKALTYALDLIARAKVRYAVLHGR